MRKPDKSALRNILPTDEAMKPSDRIACKHVVDGGALLHRVHWQKGMKLIEVAEEYASYVNNNYGFAGYDDTM